MESFFLYVCHVIHKSDKRLAHSVQKSEQISVQGRPNSIHRLTGRSAALSGRRLHSALFVQPTYHSEQLSAMPPRTKTRNEPPASSRSMPSSSLTPSSSTRHDRSRHSSSRRQVIPSPLLYDASCPSNPEPRDLSPAHVRIAPEGDAGLTVSGPFGRLAATTLLLWVDFDVRPRPVVTRAQFETMRYVRNAQRALWFEGNGFGRGRRTPRRSRNREDGVERVVRRLGG